MSLNYKSVIKGLTPRGKGNSGRNVLKAIEPSRNDPTSPNTNSPNS